MTVENIETQATVMNIMKIALPAMGPDSKLISNIGGSPSSPPSNPPSNPRQAKNRYLLLLRRDQTPVACVDRAGSPIAL